MNNFIRISDWEVLNKKNIVSVSVVPGNESDGEFILRKIRVDHMLGNELKTSYVEVEAALYAEGVPLACNDKAETDKPCYDLGEYIDQEKHCSKCKWQNELDEKAKKLGGRRVNEALRQTFHNIIEALGTDQFKVEVVEGFTVSSEGQIVEGVHRA